MRFHLVMGLVMPVLSTSWNESLPKSFLETLQVTATMGDESM